jgi:ABC-type dipeptide/oligopeptide/nickel transport system ATPase component
LKVYALVGKSGTGKSTSVLHYCHEHNIPAIIDDGILIVNGQKIAGTSAKYEKNYIKAVKRATFFYEDHRKEVMNVIRMTAIDKILIVGTSVKMVDLIAVKLKLEKIQQYIDVSEIRTSKEINMARYMRNTQGKHVIPIPYTQVESNKLKRILQKGKSLFSKHSKYIGEETIIQPHFTIGTISIDENVYREIILYTCKKIKYVRNAKILASDFSTFHNVTVEIELNFPDDRYIVGLLEEIQQKINEALLAYFEIEINTIRIVLGSLKLEV